MPKEGYVCVTSSKIYSQNCVTDLHKIWYSGFILAICKKISQYAINIMSLYMP